MVHEPDQPFLVDRVEAPDIRIEYVVHLLADDSGDQRIQRIMLAALRSKSVRQPGEICLIDPVQHCCHRSFDNLILKRGDGERALPTIRLRYVPSL